jgi:hypothetical protein
MISLPSRQLRVARPAAAGAPPLLYRLQHLVTRRRQLGRRSPIAAAIALVSAGRKPESEPLAGLLGAQRSAGSMLSTMCTSIGGESPMVGIR